MNTQKDEKFSSKDHEEISEKRTSGLGYILLMLMVIFVVIVGETVFQDLKKLPERGEAPSYCVLNTADSLETKAYLSCPGYNGFNAVDKEFELDTLFNAILPDLEKIVGYNTAINEQKAENSSLENNLQGLTRDYDLSLQEKMAGEDAITNKGVIKSNITSSQAKIVSNNKKITSLEKQRDAVIKKIESSTTELKEAYDEAYDDYRTTAAWYNFKIFLLQFIFVLPFFFLSVFFYTKLKKKNSPYTIILTAATTAFSILFLQVVLVFLYDILPKEFFARIFNFLMNVAILRYVIYYGSVVLVIGLFGGIVYYIQKRVFNPTKVAIRRLKEKKCPGCSFPLDSELNFCPDCGLQLKEKCPHCAKLKTRYLSHCQYCGKE